MANIMQVVSSICAHSTGFVTCARVCCVHVHGFSPKKLFGGELFSSELKFEISLDLSFG